MDLSALVRTILAEQLVEHPQRDVQCRIADGLSAQCDPQLARSALENLLGNALKYSRDQADTVIEFGCSTAEASTRSASRRRN